MGNEATLVTGHEADEGERAQAETKTKEKWASALREKVILETKVEICRFHRSNLGELGKRVVNRRQKNCKRIVRKTLKKG